MLLDNLRKYFAWQLFILCIFFLFLQCLQSLIISPCNYEEHCVEYFAFQTWPHESTEYHLHEREREMKKTYQVVYNRKSF